MVGHRTLLMSAAWASLALALPSAALASWAPNGVPVCVAPGTQVLKQAIPDGSGGIYVLFTTPDDTGDMHLLQRVGRDGLRPAGWPAQGITVAQAPRSWATGAAPDGAGGAYVCWVMERGQFADEYCYLLRINPDGQRHPAWPVGGVLIDYSYSNPGAGASASLWPVGLVTDVDGTSHVAVSVYSSYCHDSYCGSQSILYVHRRSSTGGSLGSLHLGSCSNGAPQGVFAPDGTGGLVGHLYYPCGTQRVLLTWASTGDSAWRPLPGQFDASRALLSDGSAGWWLVGNPAPLQGELRVQRTDMGGMPLPGWESGAPTPLAYRGMDLRVLPDGDGGLDFVWADPAAPTEIRSYRLLPDGLAPPTWEQSGLIVTPAPARAGAFDAASDGTGGVYVAWIDLRDESTSGRDLYAAHVLGDGSFDPVLHAGGRAICLPSSEHAKVLVVPTEPGAAIVVWGDNRDGNGDIYAQRLPLDQVTAATATLIRAEPIAGGARLAWRVSGEVTSATVQRRLSSDGWTGLAHLLPDGLGEIAYEDHGLAPGTRAGYRLALGGGTAGEAWVSVPGSGLALAGFSPNPGGPDVTLTFTLASGDPASVEVLDVAGRRSFARDLAGFGPGQHRLPLEERLAAGLYFIRLVQAGVTVAARGVVTR